MEPKPDDPTAGPKIPDSAKESLQACPMCGRGTDGGMTMTKEKCPYPDCGRTYQVITYK